MKIALQLKVTLLMAGCLLLAGCHRAAPIELTIVDELSGQPVAGMPVVANWQAMGEAIDVNQGGQLKLMEAVSDKKGHVAFPAWGPKIAWVGKEDLERVRLLFFKNGYRPLVLSNEVKAMFGYTSTLQSEWNGKTIKVRPVDSVMTMRIQEFDLFNNDVRPTLSNLAECPWNKMPNMLREIHRERLALNPVELSSGGWPLASVDADLIRNAETLARAAGSSCRSPKDIFSAN